MRYPTTLLLASLTFGCNEVVSVEDVPFVDDRIATENFVDLPSTGCPGGELYAIVPLFDAKIRTTADLRSKLGSVPYSANRYTVPVSWWPGETETKQTSLDKELAEAWEIYSTYLSEAGRTSVSSFSDLSDIAVGPLGTIGLQTIAVEIPAESIEAIAGDLVEAGVLKAAAQPPAGCGPGDNVGLSLAKFPGDPRSQPESLVPYLREKLEQELQRATGDGQYSISELSRSSISGFGLPQSFQSVVFQVRLPSEILSVQNNRWLQSEITIQTLGFSPGEGVILNIFADNAKTAARTIRTTPPTEYEFEAASLEREIAVQISDLLR